MKRALSITLLLAAALAGYTAGRTDLLSRFSGLLPAAWAGPSQAQQEAQEASPPMDPKMQAMMEAGTPGEHHKVLDKLAGEWEGTFTIRMSPDAPPMTITGTMKRTWILDGRFLKEEVTSEMGGETFRGLGILGYDNRKGVYEMLWMDSTSTAIFHDQGYYDPDAKCLVTQSTNMDPMTGRFVLSHGRLDLSNPNRHVSHMYAVDEQGREYCNFEGVAERKK